MNVQFSKEEWHSAVYQVWKTFGRTNQALIVASGATPDVDITPEEWKTLAARAASFGPIVDPFDFHKPIRAVVASTCRKASDYFLDGKPTLGMAALNKRDVRDRNIKKRAYKEGEATSPLDRRRTKTISARTLDKRHDWNTVK